MSDCEGVAIEEGCVIEIVCVFTFVGKERRP